MKPEIIIIGAGASGLMSARELAKTGKKVLILEARDRIGGRIWPLRDDEFGYHAQAGAEFVHGPAKVTRDLMKEAGLTYVPMDGELWSVRDGEATKNQEFMPYQDVLDEKLKELTEDMPIAKFLDLYFSDEKYKIVRNSVNKMVEGYDAADPNRISTFSLRDEWLSSEGSSGGDEWQQGRIKEGYGALLNFLESDCKKFGVEIRFDQYVKSIGLLASCIQIHTDTEEYKVPKVIVTAALPTLKDIHFNPELNNKIEAASKIGFGNVIKILMRFKSQWWLDAGGKGFSKLMFMLSNEKVTTWWTQYPDSLPVLTGWIAGPTAENFKGMSSEEILEQAFTSLSNIFKVEKEFLKNELVNSKVVNWPADPLAKGAYSYTTPETKEAYKVLVEPVDNALFFAGEALYNGKETATVEGALASGKAVAEQILKENMSPS